MSSALRVVVGLVLCGIGLSLLAGVSGCRRGGGVPQPEAVANLQKIAVFYGRYAQRHQGKTPPDEASFKKFILDMDPTERGSMTGSDIDALFVSPRDGQALVIRYGFEPGPPSPQGSAVIAYEQTGSGGRYVAFALGGVEKVSEARFKQLVPTP
jgi:hypothetical protein